MDKIQIEPIGPANLHSVVELLEERNHTLPAYTQWKYGAHHNGCFRGVVALRQGEPVGCFGLLVRDLVLPECRTISCGWFADWYVTSRVRAAGLGTQMLQALSENCALILGHPGPEKARTICLVNGYRRIDFQSRRRLVFRRFDYERLRTRYFVKAAANVVLGLQRSTTARLQSKSFGHNGTNGASHGHVAHFANAREQCRWILTQPVRSDFSRSSGVWQADGLEVVYVDDWISTTGFRRRMLLATGRRQFSLEAWKAFFQETRRTNCLYVEQFTTSRRLDHVWAACGAWRYPDAPVLLRGQLDLRNKLLLQGCDRENWTYLAGGRHETNINNAPSSSRVDRTHSHVA
ncbi:MAG TPA: GNAT family N-acetyltransferase [Verrucomicrobiae bacterium]|nr:GNAT family N-acetyltransferase [Verrucomicrobiae bacterium]